MFRLVIKDLKLFRTDRRAILLTFFVPIALITLFALAFGGEKRERAKATNLIVSDEDKSDASKRLIAQLDSLKEIDVEQTSTDSAQRKVKKGDESAVLVIHKGLKDSIDKGAMPNIELQYDQSREMEVGILQSALTGNLMRLMGKSVLEKRTLAQFDAQNPQMDSANRAMMHKQILANFQSSTAPQQPVLRAIPIMIEQQIRPGLIQAVSGTAVMMLLFSVTALGAALLDEKQEGTLKKLLYSPLRPTDILFGKMISSNIVCIVQLSIMFIYAHMIFGLDILHHLPGLIMMILATAYACTSFGMLLASVAKSRQQVQALSTLLVLTMSAIGGSMIPIFIMPVWMQHLAHISVNYWAIQGFYDIFWRLIPPNNVVFLHKLAVLIIIGTVLNLVALRMFKRNVLKLA